jgi:hypothetical protein
MGNTVNQLATHRYSTFQSWMGVPICISTGMPNWMPGLDYVSAMKPIGLRDIVTDEEFIEKYLARLDSREGAIHSDLVSLSDKYPGQRLVLLCYEDLVKGTEMCHRTTAAGWLALRGLEVPELPADLDDAIDAGLAAPVPNRARVDHAPIDTPLF